MFGFWKNFADFFDALPRFCHKACMHTKNGFCRCVVIRICLLLLGAFTLSAQAQLLWTVGLDDNGWPMGDGGGANASFVQENASINDLPGSPESTEDPQGADNDYYFAGT